LNFLLVRKALKDDSLLLSGATSTIHISFNMFFFISLFFSGLLRSSKEYADSIAAIFSSLSGVTFTLIQSFFNFSSASFFILSFTSFSLFNL